MSSTDVPDDDFIVHRRGDGRLFAQEEELPDLQAVLSHARRLAGLELGEAAEEAGVPGKPRGSWTVEFTYRGRPFVVHTDYDAGATVYSAAAAGCPEPLFREVVAYFAGTPTPAPTWVPPPPLTPRRLLALILIALAVAVPLVVFLTVYRKQ